MRRPERKEVEVQVEGEVDPTRGRQSFIVGSKDLNWGQIYWFIYFVNFVCATQETSKVVDVCIVSSEQ